MNKIFIDYGERINTAILGVIKDILKDLEESKYHPIIVFTLHLKQKTLK